MNPQKSPYKKTLERQQIFYVFFAVVLLLDQQRVLLNTNPLLVCELPDRINKTVAVEYKDEGCCLLLSNHKDSPDDISDNIIDPCR